MASYENTVIKKMNYNGQKVKKWYHDGVKVFTAGNVVTYYVNTGTSYQEEVDSEASCLSPTTFTPELSGYTFVGWREDTTASSEVLSEKAMGDEPISLYAVFKRILTATFNGNGATSGSVASISDTQYYNNGNNGNPTITLPANGYSRTDYTFNGWDKGAAGSKYTLTGNETINAQWKQSTLRLVTSGSLGSGVSSSLVAGYSAQHGYFAGIYANGSSFPYSVTPVKVRIMSDGEDEISAGCIIRLSKPITGGSGSKIYFNVSMGNIMSSGVNAAGAAVKMGNTAMVIELINASSGAHTILWQRAHGYDGWSGWSSGGYYYNPSNIGVNVGNSVTVDTSATVPSGTYYLQCVFHHKYYGSGNPVYECSINNCYVTL